MPKSAKTQASKHQPDALILRMKYYPFRIMTYVILTGITSAFLFLSVAYFLTTFGTKFNNFGLPLIFHANTVIILFSSYAMAQTRKAIYADDQTGYLTGLLVTAALGAAFMAFQVIGWKELGKNGVNLTNNIAGSYLYVISGLHLLHLVIGIGLLGFFAFNALGMQTDPVKSLLFETNPYSKLKVDLLCTYWHFVDGLWIYLYVFFLLNIYVLTKGGFKPLG